MAVYDGRQMNRMRQDAIRRSREMYGRQSAGIDVITKTTNNYPAKKKEKSDCTNKSELPQHESENHSLQKKSSGGNELSELFGKILGGKLDGDKLIIIALMIMLAKEGADLKLILALGYILI